MCLVSFALWVPPVEHVQSKTRPSGSRRHNYVTQKLRAPVSVPAFFLFFCLAVAVDLDVVPEL